MYQPQTVLSATNYASGDCPSFGAQPPGMAQWINQGTTSGIYPAHRTVGHPTVGNGPNALGIGGISLTTILFLVFLVLKLTDVIDWNWWWVTSPLWLGFAIVAVLAVIGGAFTGLAAAV